MASPGVELAGDVDGAASEGCVASGGCPPIDVVGFDPSINQFEWVNQAKLTRALLLDETLTDKVLYDARDETRTGVGAVYEFALAPGAVAVGEQGTDDAGALSDEDVPRFQLEAEVAAWQGATIHEDASGADVCAAIEVDGGQSLVVAEFQNARRKFGCDEHRWLRVFPVGKQGLQLR